MSAATHRHQEVVTLLILAGANCKNHTNRIPTLWTATCNARLQIVKLLLDTLENGGYYRSLTPTLPYLWQQHFKSQTGTTSHY